MSQQAGGSESSFASDISLVEVDGQAEPSTSVSTICGLRRLETSFPDPTSMAAYPQYMLSHSPAHGYSSGHSAPSTPPSPTDSVSSFPSVGSSFLFSSGPASPPFPHTQPPSRADPPDDVHQQLNAAQLPLTSGLTSSHFQSSERSTHELQDLVMPSLSLASSSVLPIPAHPGQALGDVSVLLLGPRSAVTELADFLLESEDVLERASWEDLETDQRRALGPRARVLRGSTDWVHRSQDLQLRTVPARNVEIVALWDGTDDEKSHQTALSLIQHRFHALREVLHPAASASQPMVARLCAAPAASLFITVVLVGATERTKQAQLATLGHHVPLVILPPSGTPQSGEPSFLRPPETAAQIPISSTPHRAPLSAFRPTSALALRDALFHSPSVRTLLRTEAAERFLHWRAIEQAVDDVEANASSSSLLRSTRRSIGADTSDITPIKSETEYPLVTPRAGNPTGSLHTATLRAKNSPIARNKAQWEAEWEGNLSRDIALSLRRRRVTQTASPSYFTLDFQQEHADEYASPPCTPLAFDPLHLPSLLAASLSLLRPLRGCLGLRDTVMDQSDTHSDLGTAQVRDETARRAMPASRHGSERRGVTGVGIGLGLGLALISAFCAGVGIGVLVTRM
ncbi:hypothetical protein CERSUDRAFT_114766 [Gelatoporia subvermispora B]|uniref:Uncharacterized protein n=1 Tax=Ceriporiopsis subvermispora (strain B) TaxID=914234 RepID=M2PKM8_CERS8|nr:hypothetical protein CERSUDRAFT_114766 [Gelatoporia subvermispora B]